MSGTLKHGGAEHMKGKTQAGSDTWTSNATGQASDNNQLTNDLGNLATPDEISGQTLGNISIWWQWVSTGHFSPSPRATRCKEYKNLKKAPMVASLTCNHRHRQPARILWSLCVGEKEIVQINLGEQVRSARLKKGWFACTCTMHRQLPPRRTELWFWLTLPVSATYFSTFHFANGATCTKNDQRQNLIARVENFVHGRAETYLHRCRPWVSGLEELIAAHPLATVRTPPFQWGRSEIPLATSFSQSAALKERGALSHQCAQVSDYEFDSAFRTGSSSSPLRWYDLAPRTGLRLSLFRRHLFAQFGVKYARMRSTGFSLRCTTRPTYRIFCWPWSSTFEVLNLKIDTGYIDLHQSKFEAYAWLWSSAWRRHLVWGELSKKFSLSFRPYTALWQLARLHKICLQQEKYSKFTSQRGKTSKVKQMSPILGAIEWTKKKKKLHETKPGKREVEQGGVEKKLHQQLQKKLLVHIFFNAPLLNQQKLIMNQHS